ncbi:hypothetical protein BHE74_00019590 [Ensete ventricosum]|nr:hypothetical protein BHE74_00019590 [Ensete ventricosum]RZR98771.1 hypothetical protein BHM03_00028197 [Ensete ventricosum]
MPTSSLGQPRLLQVSAGYIDSAFWLVHVDFKSRPASSASSPDRLYRLGLSASPVDFKSRPIMPTSSLSQFISTRPLSQSTPASSPVQFIPTRPLGQSIPTRPLGQSTRRLQVLGCHADFKCRPVHTDSAFRPVHTGFKSRPKHYPGPPLEELRLTSAHKSIVCSSREEPSNESDRGISEPTDLRPPRRLSPELAFRSDPSNEAARYGKVDKVDVKPVRDDDDKRNGYSPDPRGRERSRSRGRGRSSSPYARGMERASPDYGHAPSPYAKAEEKASPSYERAQSPADDRDRR